MKQREINPLFFLKRVEYIPIACWIFLPVYSWMYKSAELNEYRFVVKWDSCLFHTSLQISDMLVLCLEPMNLKLIRASSTCPPLDAGKKHGFYFNVSGERHSSMFVSSKCLAFCAVFLIYYVFLWIGNGILFLPTAHRNNYFFLNTIMLATCQTISAS